MRNADCGVRNLTGGFGMYAFLSHKAYDAFANSVPFIDNVFISAGCLNCHDL